MQPILVPIQDETTLQGTFVANAKPERKISFSLLLRPKILSCEEQTTINRLLTNHPSRRTYLSHEETAKYTSYADHDRDAIVNYLSGFNLIYSENKLLRELHCTGKVGDFESAFYCTVGVYDSKEDGEFISVISSIHLPVHLAEKIYAFVGFEQPLKREYRKPTPVSGDDDGGWQKGFSIADITSAYEFPENLKGKGQCIGVVELGGMHNEADLDLFFKKVKVKKPKIEIVGDQPGHNNETNNGEVSMDLQIIGAIAPKATVVIYYARTFIEALKLIIDDNVHKPSVVSISWSAPEEYYNDSEKREFDQLLYQAALLGISIVGSSGDHGAYNNLEHPNVPMPASHPLVLGCGGTTVNIEDGKRLGEIVWNEFKGDEVTGGGFSNTYGAPDYQQESLSNYSYNYVIPNGRGVPDVAGLSSTIDGFQVILDGMEAVVGGTSTATPMWSALIVLLNESLGYRLGFTNKIFYDVAGTSAFYSIVNGNNLLYQAGPYWNPCTGLGSPNGNEILNQIKLLQSNQ